MSTVVAVHADGSHRFAKVTQDAVVLLAGLGVAGDAHCGATVRHRGRVVIDPTRPNLRQVHLLGIELLDELAARGFPVAPGVLGENVTTQGIDLLGLSTGTVLGLGDALVAVTGLRNPCAQLDGVAPGLQAAVLARGPAGELVRRAGVMGVVVAGGTVRPGDGIELATPPGPFRPLEPV
ncbi:MAG: MOSC domain-containing protein [Acidimicrobiales bacterium]